MAVAFGALDDLEMLERGRVDEQRVGARAEHNRAHVRQIEFLRVAEVMHERAGGGDGRGMMGEAEAVEPARAKLREERAVGGLGVEHPRVDLGCGNASRADRRRQRRPGRDDELAGFQHGHLVGERLQPVGSDRKSACRERVYVLV